MCKSVMICLAILAAATTVLAQADPAKSCADSTLASLDFNNKTFEGRWLEVARNPSSSVSCIDLNIGFWNSTSNVTYMLVNVSHSSNNQSLYQDVNEKVNLTLSSTPVTTGYNVSFVNGAQQSYVFIKLLQVVNSTYLLGCSYTDASNVSTSAGFILARSNYTSSLIAQVNNDASANYTNFVNGTVNTVAQTGCFASSAGKSLPLITGFLAIALLLIKA